MAFKVLLVFSCVVFARAFDPPRRLHTPCSSGVPAGTDGVVCEQLQANGFIFDCRFGGDASSTKGNVVLLHGFPEWSSMYQPFMKTLAEHGYRSVACDQRGYAQHARPGNVTDYNYNKLRSDVFAVAEGAGFDKFHLVAHDHGAVLGWYTAGSDLGKKKVLSYAALSIPHNNAFDAGLFGPTADVQQQCASQYFTMFVAKNSAESVFCAMKSGTFHSCNDFQKALWWYNGAMDAGVMAMPPIMSAPELLKDGWGAMAALRLTWGGTPNQGHAAKTPTGDIVAPTLYVCGKHDSSILCNRPFALKTKDYVKSDYTYLEVDCGHGVIGCGNTNAAILSHITKSTQSSNATIVV